MPAEALRADRAVDPDRALWLDGPDGPLRRADPGLRRSRRPAGGTLRTGLLPRGRREEHVRDRLVPAPAHGGDSRPEPPRAPHDRRGGAGGRRAPTRSRAPSPSPDPPSSGCATASGSSRRGGDRSALARVGPGLRRRLFRAGVLRPLRAALGHDRARHDRRAHALRDARAPRARDPRGDRVPEPRRCSTRWRPTAASRPESLKVDGGADRERFSDAAPGRRPRHPRRPPGGARDDGARRRAGRGPRVRRVRLRSTSSRASGAAIAVFEPEWTRGRREEGLRSWKRAVERSRDWIEENGKPGLVEGGSGGE